MKWDIIKFSDEIFKHSRNSIITVLLRHSIREPITDRDSLRYASLTKEGRNLAREFGGRLPKDRNIRIFHSPVLRCKETADYIYQGIKQNNGSASIIGGKDFLYGNYILEPERVVDLLTDFGVEEFVEKWFNDQFDKSTIIPPGLVRREMLNSIISFNRNDPMEIDLHISHDLNLILFKSLIFDVFSDDFEWPEFMEGVILKKKNNIITICLKDEEKQISFD